MYTVYKTVNLVNGKFYILIEKKMFPTLKQNFGNTAFVFPLTTILGMIFGAPVVEIVYAALLLYITGVFFLIADDIVEPPYALPVLPLYTAKEMQQIDRFVNTKRIRVEINLRDLQQH